MDQKLAFLEKKGLTPDEIEQARHHVEQMKPPEPTILQWIGQWIPSVLGVLGLVGFFQSIWKHQEETKATLKAQEHQLERFMKHCLEKEHAAHEVQLQCLRQNMTQLQQQVEQLEKQLHETKPVPCVPVLSVWDQLLPLLHQLQTEVTPREPHVMLYRMNRKPSKMVSPYSPCTFIIWWTIRTCHAIAAFRSSMPISNKSSPH